MAVRRVPVGDPGSPVEASTAAGPWGLTYLALAEFLTLTVAEDGKPRQRGTLTLFFDDDAWKVSLNDRDSGSVAFVTGSSPVEALEAANRGLAQSRLGWRRSKTKGGK